MRIKEIFYSIQGEGIYVGYPAIFIRLEGCPLKCKWEGGKCDTDFENGEEISIEGILEEVKGLDVMESRSVIDKPIIVITGGEPGNYILIELIEELIDNGYKIQIETSGVIWRDERVLELINRGNPIKIICSPKTSKIDKKLEGYVSAYKYILEEGNIDSDGLPKRNPINGKELYRCGSKNRIYINPVDSGDIERNRRNLEVVIESGMRNGYIVGIQLHKYLEMR